MERRSLIVGLLILALGILVLLELVLTPYLPPQIVLIEWEEEGPIDTPGSEVLYVRVLAWNGTRYLFYTAHPSDDPGNRSMYYMVDSGEGWSGSVLVPLSVPPYGRFDCALDEASGEFLVFYSNATNASHWIFNAYMTRGRLGELGPAELLPGESTMGRRSMTGPFSFSAFFADNGTLYLVYMSLAGVSENANGIYFRTLEQGEWSDPVRVGTGNSPAAIQTRAGKVLLYTNLWTFVPGPQRVVDEWRIEDGRWRMTELTVTEEDSNVNPYVVEDGNGTLFLLYDHRMYRPDAKHDRVVIHTRREGEGWSLPEVIWSGGEEWTLQSVCAIVEGDTIEVFWVSEGRLLSMEGSIQY